MTGQGCLRAIFVLALPLAGLIQEAAAQNTAPEFSPNAAGGVADVAVQGYYLGGNSQPLTALSGIDVSFRQYFPKLGFITGNLEGYADSSRGRVGQNSITLNGLRWKGRRWTLTGGDYRVRMALVPVPFTNYSYPEIGARGAKVEMLDGHRQYTFFWGEETLQAGPRISFRTQVPQAVLGAAVVQNFGSRVQVGVRYLGLSSGEKQVEEKAFFFPVGGEIRRHDSLSLQAAWFAWRGLTFFSDTSVAHQQFAAISLFPHARPFSFLTGARWKTKRLTATANYGSLSRSALPVVGYYFGDRAGPFAEVRYNIYKTLELFGSALRSGNNLEKNPALLTFSTRDVTVGANVTLPWQIGVSGQYSKLGLRGELATDATQNQKQRSTQAQLSVNKSVGMHSLLLTARDLDLTGTNYRQKQKSAEVQDNLHFSRFLMGAAVRLQQQSGGGQLQNSLFVRGSGQVRLRGISIYGQFETGNDLINKTLFATNSVNTTVAGVEIPLVNRWKAHGWTVRAEAFRTTLVAALNPANILVLQSRGAGVSDILNDFNQWSFFLRMNHRTHWGAALPETEFATNQVVYGAIEGFVYDDATGSHGAPDVSVQLDKSRTAVTDATGRYRFSDVPEGAHSVALDMAELGAAFSPGPGSPACTVKPRGLTRVDLRVVTVGSSIRGRVQGLAKEDEGTVRLDSVVINIAAAGGQTPGDTKGDRYTTSDGAGDFAFYNLTPGRYRVSLDSVTLPEDYKVQSDPEVEADLRATGDAPPVIFRIGKQIKELPVRKVFEARLLMPEVGVTGVSVATQRTRGSGFRQAILRTFFRPREGVQRG